MTRRLLIPAAVLAAGVVVGVPASWADDSHDDGKITIIERDPRGGYNPPDRRPPVVGIGVKDGGQRNGRGGSGSGDGSGTGGCSYDGPLPDDFRGDMAADGPKPDPKAKLYIKVCDGAVMGMVWLTPADTPPPVTAAQLADQAYRELALPLPKPRHSPDLALRNGQSAVLVGEHTWVWVDQADWHPVSRKAQAGAVWAEATAIPVELRFDPGNGERALACPGPGTVYQRGRHGLHERSPDCDFQFGRSSYGQPGDTVAATYSIRWRVTWVGSSGAGPTSGTLDDLISQASVTFAVAEGQALITG